MAEQDTRVVMSSVMMPSQANHYGNVHGGEIMKLMDSTAGATAVKFVRGDCVTARVDELQFHLPVHIGDFVVSTGRVVYTGTTSLEIYVTVEVEDFRHAGGPQLALDAYFTMVAVDTDDRPTPVPQFVPATADEKAQWELVHARREASRQRRVRDREKAAATNRAA